MNNSSSYRAAWWVYGLVAFYGLMPLIIWLRSIESLVDYFQYTLPPGQLSYVLSKLMGFYALSVLSIQVVLGLSLPRTRWHRLHLYTGLCSFGAVMLHASLFIYAASVRSGHLATQLFLPRFFEGYYEFGVSLGIAGFWVVLIVVLAGACRLYGISGSRWPHYLALPMFVVVYSHSLLIGSETRILLTNLFHGVIALTVLAALWIRWQELDEVRS